MTDAAKLDPSADATAFDDGLACWMRGEVDAAERALRRALDEGELVPESRLLLATLRYEAGDEDEARALLAPLVADGARDAGEGSEAGDEIPNPGRAVAERLLYAWTLRSEGAAVGLSKVPGDGPESTGAS